MSELRAVPRLPHLMDAVMCTNHLPVWNPGPQVLSDLSELMSGRAHSLSTSLGQLNMSYRVG